MIRFSFLLRIRRMRFSEGTTVWLDLPDRDWRLTIAENFVPVHHAATLTPGHTHRRALAVLYDVKIGDLLEGHCNPARNHPWCCPGLEPGFGKGGTGVLKVDGKEVANQKIPHTIPFIMTLGETFDVGLDTRTLVDENDYQVPFAFTGKVDKVSVQLNLPSFPVASSSIRQRRSAVPCVGPLRPR